MFGARLHWRLRAGRIARTAGRGEVLPRSPGLPEDARLLQADDDRQQRARCSAIRRREGTTGQVVGNSRVRRSGVLRLGLNVGNTKLTFVHHTSTKASY